MQQIAIVIGKYLCRTTLIPECVAEGGFPVMRSLFATDPELKARLFGEYDDASVSRASDDELPDFDMPYNATAAITTTAANVARAFKGKDVSFRFIIG